MTAFLELLDLASERLGGAALHANDDFFAGKENLLRPKAAVFLEHEYTDRGKWMDGWESRRRRTPGHDFCLIRLGLPGVIRGVVIDTAFFRGNYPEHASLEGAMARADASPEELLGPGTRWEEIVPRSALQGDSKNLFEVGSSRRFTHLRLNIFPDGGVARLRVHGEPMPDWSRLGRGRSEVDLAAAENGAQVVSCSDMFFGVRHNLIAPGRAANMGEGWETRRRRGIFPEHVEPGKPIEYTQSDWALVKLCAEGTIARVEVDTNHFKGNYPESCKIEGCLAPGSYNADVEGVEWRPVLARTVLQPHTRHFYEEELVERGPFTHARITVYPDGGVSRLRVWGAVTRRGVAVQRIRRLDSLSREEAEAELLTCCGSTKWAREVARKRPFGSLDVLFAMADEVFATLAPEDWLEAFRAHPRIGERKAAREQTASEAQWSKQEQAGVAGAMEETAAALAEGNRAYEAKFGHIYIVCATGKSADEMLAILRERLGSTAEAELGVAAGEQRKITRIRLEKLVDA
jgi:allantoicase